MHSDETESLQPPRTGLQRRNVVHVYLIAEWCPALRGLVPGFETVMPSVNHSFE